MSTLMLKLKSPLRKIKAATNYQYNIPVPVACLNDTTMRKESLRLGFVSGTPDTKPNGRRQLVAT